MKERLSTYYNDAVMQIKTAILRSQAKAPPNLTNQAITFVVGIEFDII